MKPNQILSISIKEPPNPEALITLGVFTNVSPTKLTSLLSGIPEMAEHDEIFKENVKDVVRKVIDIGEIIAVKKNQNEYTFTVRIP